MNRIYTVGAASLLLALALSAPVARGASPTVAVYGSLTTVRPDASLPAGSRQEEMLTAARNEAESFQVVVSAGGSARSGVAVERGSVLIGPKRARIPQANVTIYREAYYNVGTASDAEGATGRWPDALIPSADYFYGERRNAFPVDLGPSDEVVAWVDILVPLNQPVGRYTGSVVVRDSAGLVDRVPVHVTVLGFALPSTSSLTSSFDISTNQICDAQTGASTCSGDSDERWLLTELYARAALENRVTISDPNPLGNGTAPTSPDQVANFERYVRPLLDGTSTTRLPGARLTAFDVNWACASTCLAAWRDLAQRDGFADRFFVYACDEPGTDPTAWAACNIAAADARAVWPGVPILVTSPIQDAQASGSVATPDILATIANWMDNAPCCDARFVGNQRDAYDSFLADDTPGTARNQVWLYTMCYTWGCGHPEGEGGYWRGWPGYAIDEPASQQRALGWLSFEYAASGELYWNTTNMLKTAWTDQNFEHGNGDGTLFYPGIPRGSRWAPAIGGIHDIPIESIRLKRIRDGREDYEYLHWLAAHGRGAFARKVTESLFGPRGRAMYSATVSEKAVAAARARLAGRIVLLLDKTPPRTSILSILLGPGRRIQSGRARFVFVSSERGSRFSCSLDATRFASCGSPRVYRNLHLGLHSFRVFATDRAGNRDRTPAMKLWRVSGRSRQL